MSEWQELADVIERDRLSGRDADLLRAEAARLRQELDEARAELAERDRIIDRVHAAEKAFLSRAVDAEREVARLRPVVEAAEAWRGSFVHTEPPEWDRVSHALIAAVDAFRSATPDVTVVPAALISAEGPPSPQPLRKKSRYTIPGLDGVWRFMGLETTNMAADGRAILHMVREASTPDAEPAPGVPVDTEATP